MDEGFTLTLALLARADVLLAQKEFNFAIEDLKLAVTEGVPEAMRCA